MAPKSQPTSRDRLVASTVELMRRQGYAASGVSEIARNGRAPMGSFYHHFPGGKEQLAAAALDRGASEYAALIEHALKDDGPLTEQLARIATLTADSLERTSFELGCPVATTALETVSTSPVLQDRAAHAFASWQKLLTQHCVNAGVPESKAVELAMTVIALIEGSELMSRVQRDRRPLSNAADVIKTLTATTLRG